MFPPILTLQYHFDPLRGFKPYIGAGVQYMAFFDEGHSNLPGSPKIDLDPAWGFALQGGVDVEFGQGWYLNVDIKKVWLDTDANWGTLAKANVTVDPLIVSLGVGYRFNLSDLFGRRAEATPLNRNLTLKSRAIAKGPVQPGPFVCYRSFAASLCNGPSNIQKQFFELALSRLDDLKLDLKEGNESEASLLRKAENEYELRRAIVNRLRKRNKRRRKRLVSGNQASFRASAYGPNRQIIASSGLVGYRGHARGCERTSLAEVLLHSGLNIIFFAWTPPSEAHMQFHSKSPWNASE